MLTRLISMFILSSSMLLTAGTAFAQRVQEVFASPEAAMEQFGAAVRNNDREAIRQMLGDDYESIIPPVTQDDYKQFLAAWDKKHQIVLNDPNHAHIGVGDKGWTLPIPLVKQRNGWMFDMDEAQDEIHTRAIGANELAVIQVMLAYHDAQSEYAEADRNGDGVLEYAQKIQSSPGTKDGLYWPTTSPEKPSPLGELFVDATAKGALEGKGYYGYDYRILKGQGKDAAGGAMSYLVRGRMIAGFALIAWPVKYGDTGVMTFVINQAGQVYQKDLGPNTTALAKRIQAFNPDSSWSKVVSGK